MTQTEALKLALEALEGLFGTAEQFEGGGVAVWRLGGSDQPKQAIAVIKEALAQEQGPTFHIDRLDKWLDASLKKRKQRTWVGLTDDETFEIGERLGLADVAWLDLIQAIEAKLKEKNNV